MKIGRLVGSICLLKVLIYRHSRRGCGNVGKNEVVSIFPHPGIIFRGSLDRFYRKSVAQSSVLVDCINFDCATDSKVVVMVTRIGMIFFIGMSPQTILIYP